VGRASGVTERQARELAGFDQSDAFDELEKCALGYADALTRTPVEVPDSLFARLAQHFDPAQLIELTSAIAWENFRGRFNHALGIEADGFMEGAQCLLPLPNPSASG
jgi:alkylhydroperoxidase family enzyme